MAKQQSSTVDIQNLEQGIEIRIIKKMNLIPVIFLGCWCAGWAAGELSVIEIIFNSPYSVTKLPLYVWFLIWSIVGCYVILIWLWNLSGKEIIRIDDKNLNHRRSFSLFLRSKNFNVNQIRNLSVATKNTSMFKFNSGMRYWGLSGGLIKFDYQQNTLKFGSELTIEQAHSIIDQIKFRYKSL